MNLGQMRQLLYANMFEENRPGLPDATANMYLNNALQHIANLMIGTDSGLVSTSCTVTTKASDYEWMYQPPIESGGVAYARQIVRARRMNESSGADPWLEVVTDATMTQHLTGELQSRPRILVYGRRITFLEPENGIEVFVEYVPVVPEMVSDDDVPGAHVDDNLIGEHWQPAIVSYATVMALAAEASNADSWRAVLSEQLAAAASSEATELQTPARN